MHRTPKDILRDITDNPTNAEKVGELVGPGAIVQTFADVGRYLKNVAFGEIAYFGDERYAALFGRMTGRSLVLVSR